MALTYERDTERANAVVDQMQGRRRRGWPIQADSGDADAATAAVDEVVSTFARLEHLVNNASVFLVGPLEDLGRDDARQDSRRERPRAVRGVRKRRHAT